MSRLQRFERLIDEKLRSVFRGSHEERTHELIEVNRAILDDVRSRVERLPRDRRVFPFPQLTVRILVPAEERRRAYEVVFEEGGELARQIRAELEDEHAEIPNDFEIAVELVSELPEAVASRAFDISYGSKAKVKEKPPGAPPLAKFTVVSGNSDKSEYTLAKKRINIGRLTDVVDSRQQLLRRNDVAFAETETPPNPTVSRTHAHIEFDAASGEYRLFDDRSALGTKVLRNGEIVTVPKGTSKGVSLESGDEIMVGQAVIRFEIL